MRSRFFAMSMVGVVSAACGGSGGADDEVPIADASSDATDAHVADAPDADFDAVSDVKSDVSADAVDAADAGYPFPTPIKYVVVIVKENHTFDNMFTGFPGTDAPPDSVKMKDGVIYTRKPAAFKALDYDTTHAHDAGVIEYNDGRMNGWSEPLSAGATNQALSYFPEAQIPSYWAYARNFVLFDRFFSTHMGPSSPGHISVHTAMTVNYENPTGDGDCHDSTLSGSVGTMDPVSGARKDRFPCFDVPVVEELLPAALTWRAYPGSPLDKVKSIGGDAKIRTAHYRPMSSLLSDLDKGELANLTIANISGVTYDEDPASEHPPQHPCNGENYTVEVVNRLMKSKYWPEIAIVFTYDDYGGFYDHVKPRAEILTNGDFIHTGFRLPAMIISPYAKKGVVDHTVTEHASIPRLIEDVFGLPRLKANTAAPWNKFTPRDAKAGSLMGAFDFKQPPRAPLLRSIRTDCPAAPPP